ncbi:MAG TPA: OmpH family outer membrane protein [Gammaproteobacteria bacterium]|jgi:Skp family chaperone for outer membrane proteins
MRQGSFAAAAFAAGLLALSPAHAATTTKSHAVAAGVPKIAVVDLQEVLGKSHRGTEATQSLQQKAAELRNQANDLNDKRKAMKDQLDKADAKSANYQTLTKQYQDADNAYQNFVQEGNQLIEQRRQELLQPIQQELGQVLQTYTKANHIDILLTKGVPGALSVSEAYDVTKGVTDALDKDWETLQKTMPAAPATPAPATPAPAATTKH